MIERLELAGKFSGTYYHGTTLERALIIKKQGLKQKRSMRNFDEVYFDGPMMRKSGVYLVEKKLRAMSYAVEGYFNRLLKTDWTPSRMKKVKQACITNKYAVIVVEIPQDYNWNLTVDTKEHNSKSYIIQEVPKEWIAEIIPFTASDLKKKLKGYTLAPWLSSIMDETP